MITVTRGVAAVALALTVLAGCADPDAPSGTASRPAASPSTEQHATPTPPAAAAQQNRAGAVAFTEHWFALLSYAIETGNTKQLRAASDRACRVCTQAITDIERAYGDGGSIHGGAYTVREATTFEDFAGRLMTVAVFYDRSPREGMSPLGVPRGRQEGAALASCDARLQWSGSGWTMRSVDGAQPVF
ncbi:DUF6318 family protein [Cryptosporangium aurantiacum]|uniref:DUF6318 family protein n=1 Tax=Cryptosporangium aurantiacum TaxID=134849 RepID=UPI0011612002|nr:DUF6318 family protein [Cryptosporangium aurantiacum]